MLCNLPPGVVQEFPKLGGGGEISDSGKGARLLLL